MQDQNLPEEAARILIERAETQEVQIPVKRAGPIIEPRDSRYTKEQLGWIGDDGSQRN